MREERAEQLFEVRAATNPKYRTGVYIDCEDYKQDRDVTMLLESPADVIQLLDEIDDAAREVFGLCRVCGGEGTCQDDPPCYECDGRGWPA